MIKINYPEINPKIKKGEKGELIFDVFRKRWINLTPEEWVRQNFLQYLVYVKKYPVTLIAIEKQIKLGDLKKRFDILIYDSNTKPWMIVECKQMNVLLESNTLSQILQYNITLQVPFLVITNGLFCKAYKCLNNQLKELDILPTFI